MNERRLLIAGIGNIFLGDDAFGVEVIRRLETVVLPPEVVLRDFGIRGFDLACALVDGYAAAILVDAGDYCGQPGTLFVLEPEIPPGDYALSAHVLDPVKALQLARALGDVCPHIRLVACQPLTFGTEDEPALGLSAPVEAAVGAAVALIRTLARKMLDETVVQRESEGG